MAWEEVSAFHAGEGSLSRPVTLSYIEFLIPALVLFACGFERKVK